MFLTLAMAVLMNFNRPVKELLFIYRDITREEAQARETFFICVCGKWYYDGMPHFCTCCYQKFVPVRRMPRHSERYVCDRMREWLNDHYLLADAFM